MNKRYAHRHSAQQGSTVAILLPALLLTALLAGGMFYYQGSKLQQQQEKLLSEGYDLFNQGDLDQAYPVFKSALTTFSAPLSFYRLFVAGEHLSNPDDIHEITVSVALSVAHEMFFDLQSADDWVSRAEEDLTLFSDSESEGKTDLTANTATAKSISQLCKTYNQGNYEQAMLDLLEIEKNSLSSDQDFFIFEIRFLIACGKALNEPAIINQARELLFFATTDAGIDNEKTRSLWGILTN